MKLEINIDPTINETLVKIYAKSRNRDVELIESILSNTQLNKIVAFRDDEIRILELKEIISFFTSEKKVFAKTLKADYMIKSRIYELEEKLRGMSFIKISQGEIVNLDYVKRLDLTFKGTIAVELKNGYTTYVARRSLKDFKETLGL